MVPCDAYNAEILRYLDNDLDGHELDEFLAHIETCESCRTNLVAEKALSELFHRTRPLYPTPSTLRSLARATLRTFQLDFQGIRVPALAARLCQRGARFDAGLLRTRRSAGYNAPP